MKLFLLFLAFMVIQKAGAQKVIHDPNVESRAATGFHSIEVSGGLDVFLSYGEEALAISARDEDTRKRIITEVENGVLKIYFNGKDGMKLKWNTGKMRVYISVKELRSLQASGGTDIRISGEFKAHRLVLSASGGSDITGRIRADELMVRASGGSDVRLTGSAAKVDADASGGSDITGYDLVTEEGILKASGGSDISITVSREVSAQASGGSDINWKGTAKVKLSKASGAGSVRHRS